MSLSQTRKSHGHLKWRIRLLAFSLRCVNLNNLLNDTSKLNMHVIYESVAQRDQVLKLPFAQGINMAHNRLQDIVSKLK